MTEKQKVLITGCSDSSLGSALAIAFHAAGLEVYATARDTNKMQALKNYDNIHLLRLDIQSNESIAECVNQVPALDILVNNAGGGYNMPLVDVGLSEAKNLFEMNLWGALAVTQAFMPRLLASASGSGSGTGTGTGKKPIIVNHTSCASVCPVPFQGIYNASKAALASLSETLRLELEPFDIKVVELKSALVESQFHSNIAGKEAKLPSDSIYAPALPELQRSIRGGIYDGAVHMPAAEWAEGVVSDLLNSECVAVWRGTKAFLVRLAGVLPRSVMDYTCRDVVRMDKIDELIRAGPNPGTDSGTGSGTGAGSG